MKKKGRRSFVRFLLDGRWRFGTLAAGRVVPLRGSIFGSWEEEPPSLALSSLRLGPPCRPSKIVAVGVNYRGHAREMGAPSSLGTETLPEAAVGRHRTRRSHPLPRHGGEGGF